MLDEVRSRGALVWCADQEGGGPYVYPRDDDPARVTGFEVELADALAARLGVRARLQQGPWDKLGDLVRLGTCDVVLNGYEVTPERTGALDATVPYYVYRLQPLVRSGQAAGWDALPRGAKVGVLTGSAAETVARDRCARPDAPCEVVGFDGNTDAMREVETGRLDATLQDTPIARFYAPRFPGLVASGAALPGGHYAMFVRRGEPRLRDALSEGVAALHRDGTLSTILRRYGIDDDAQRALAPLLERATAIEPPPPAPAPKSSPSVPSDGRVELGERKRGFEVVRAYGGVLVQSAGLTVALAVLAFPLAAVLGLVVAIGRRFGPRAVAFPLAVYVEIVRGTPLMLQLYALFFLLPELGIVLPAFVTGVVGLGLNYAAYEAEIYRAGLDAVPTGQLEAALSLGMTRTQAVRRVVVPQAIRLVIPPVVNDFIALFKDTSVVSVITLVELTKRFSVLSMSTQATFELMAITAVLYLLMSYPLSLAARRLERHLATGAT